VLALTPDVTDRDAARAAVAHAHEHFGRLDIVVNNAGHGHFGMMEEITEQEPGPRSRPTCSGRCG
jgi:NAD(P)-dependent dehydrogenase (short-subunit alcohol dehydrogenase family)